MIQLSIPKEIENKRSEILEIAKEHGVVQIKIFGSTVNNKQTLQSDIDFLIEFEEGRSLFDLVSLKDDLEQLLDRPVDIATKDSIHIAFREKVLNEAIEI